MSHKQQALKQIRLEEKERKLQKLIDRKSKKLAEKISKMSEADQQELIRKLNNKLKILNAEMNDCYSTSASLNNRKEERDLTEGQIGAMVLINAILAVGISTGISSQYIEDFFVNLLIADAFGLVSLPVSLGIYLAYCNKPLSNAIAKIKEKANKNKQKKITNKINEIDKKLALVNQNGLEVCN